MFNLSFIHQHIWIVAGVAAALLAGGVAGASLAIDDQPAADSSAGLLQIDIVKSGPTDAR